MQQVLTDNFESYIACAVKANKPNLYIGIGTGNPSWDTGGLPDVSPDTSSLLNPVSIKPVDSIDFLDSEGEVSSSPTNILSFNSYRFTADEFEGAVRECGLFYSDGETSFMITYSVFSRVDITPQITLTKNIILRLGSSPAPEL